MWFRWHRNVQRKGIRRFLRSSVGYRVVDLDIPGGSQYKSYVNGLLGCKRAPLEQVLLREACDVVVTWARGRR
jgi:hypothetical protein